jgi:hypothetical protein
MPSPSGGEGGEVADVKQRAGIHSHRMIKYILANPLDSIGQMTPLDTLSVG